MSKLCLPKSVVVGIDGSQAAIRAARWAVREVAGTAASLRLLYCSELHPDANRKARSEMVAAAEKSVHDACRAIEALGQAVKIEVDMVEDHPLRALVEASESAQLLCIGNAESGTPCGGGFGSTAAQLAQSAYCSLAVVRDEHHTDVTDDRSIVTLVDGSATDDAALEWGFDEANRRDAALVLTTAYRTGFDLQQKDSALLDHDRCMRAILDRYVLARGPRYPHVRVRTVTAFSTFVGYLTDHAASTQLAVISAQKTSEISQLFGASGAIALSHSDFSLLVVG